MGSDTLPCASYPRSEYMVMWGSQYMVMWALDRLKRYERYSGRGNLFWVNR